MAKLKVNRPTVSIGGKEYLHGDVIDHDPNSKEHLNLLRSGKVVAANIDAKLAQAGDTLSEQAAVNLAEAEGVMAGAVVSSENVKADEAAANKKVSAKKKTKK